MMKSHELRNKQLHQLEKEKQRKQVLLNNDYQLE